MCQSQTPIITATVTSAGAEREQTVAEEWRSLHKQKLPSPRGYVQVGSDAVNVCCPWGGVRRGLFHLGFEEEKTKGEGGTKRYRSLQLHFREPGPGKWVIEPYGRPRKPTDECSSYSLLHTQTRHTQKHIRTQPHINTHTHTHTHSPEPETLDAQMQGEDQ